MVFIIFKCTQKIIRECLYDFVEIFKSVLCEYAVCCWDKELQQNRSWCNKSNISPVPEKYFKNQFSKNQLNLEVELPKILIYFEGGSA